jgi:hypothetical protein
MCRHVYWGRNLVYLPATMASNGDGRTADLVQTGADNVGENGDGGSERESMGEEE